jgi:hypothetical protein
MIWLLACTGPSDSVPIKESEPPPCIAEPLTVFPEDGTQGAYWKTPIEFALSQPDSVARIVTDIPGELVLSSDSRVFKWVLTEPLNPETEYTVSLEGCFGSMSTTFTTSSYGRPLSVETSSLEGKSFEMDFQAGRDDTQVSTLIRPYLTGKIRVLVEDVRGHALTLRGQYSFVGDFSDTCDLGYQEAVFNEPPAFTTIPTDLPFPALYGFQLQGTFSPDGEALMAHVAGQWDVRDLDKISVDIGYSPEQLCGMLAAAELPCSACEDGESYCMNLEASLIPGLSAEPIEPPLEVCNSCATGKAPLVFGLASLLMIRRKAPCPQKNSKVSPVLPTIKAL